MEDPAMGSDWHLDKRVPIALIVTIFLQSMAAVWWAASMQARMDGLESMMLAQASTESRLVRVEQMTTMQARSLERIENKLDRVIERKD